MLMLCSVQYATYVGTKYFLHCLSPFVVGTLILLSQTDYINRKKSQCQRLANTADAPKGRRPNFFPALYCCNSFLLSFRSSEQNQLYYCDELLPDIELSASQNSS